MTDTTFLPGPPLADMLVRGRSQRSGTPPRVKTRKRLSLQSAMGWPTTSKLVISGGAFIHPTKGRRRNSPGRDIPVEAKHRLPSPRKRQPSELQVLLGRMTNWQRTVFSRAVAAAKLEEKRVDREALARAVVDMPHWKRRAAIEEGAPT